MPLNFNAMSANSGGGNPAKGLVVMGKKGNTPADETADLRDSINALVGGGYKTLSDEDARGNFVKLAGILGTKAAQNLFIHISQQNQRPGWNQMKPAERVSNFYNINSNNPDVNPILQRVKSFGTGPLSGYTDSVNLVNQNQQGNGLAPLVAVK